MSIKDKIIETLHKAAPGLQQLKDDFFIFGSAAMILSEVKLDNANDIDLLVSNRDAELLKDIWHARNLHVDSKESALFRSNLARYRFDPIDIEVSGDMQVLKNGKWQDFVIYDYETLPVGKLLIKIPTLQEQKNILHLFGREKDLERIKLIDERIAEIKNHNKN